MTKISIIATILTLSLSMTAYADVPNEPCDGKDEGATCELDDGGQGVCDADGACVAEADDEGCSVSRMSTRVAAGAFTAAALAGLALVARRRKRA